MHTQGCTSGKAGPAFKSLAMRPVSVDTHRHPIGWRDVGVGRWPGQAVTGNPSWEVMDVDSRAR